jgi:class 3 adenylate cyclase/predicted ATPase
LLEEIREELILRQLAIDDADKVLVWTGEIQTHTPPAMSLSSQPATAETAAVTSRAAPTLSPSVTDTSTPSNGPTAPPEDLPADAPYDEPVARASTRTAPEAERRQLTVMFCDLADSTRLSQQLDPEDLRDVVRAYQATAAEVIQQYDGHMAQYLGDGLLIYFGWPVAHEGDAQRALHAGLGVVEAITTTLNPRLEAEKGVQLTVRLGIHTGPVVVGEMGGSGRQEHLATGETVNIAARLEGLAQPNTVVISAATARLTQHAFELEDLGTQRLKGVAEPMPLFRVLKPLEADVDEAATTPTNVDLVGRDEEVGLLLRRWQQSKEGLGQVVLVSGEAGIGKSSLVETLRTQVVREGYSRIVFRCSPYHMNSALYPVINHVQRFLRLQADEAAGAKLDKLERAMRRYQVAPEERVPLFADLLSIPLPEGRYAPLRLSPPQQRQQTQDALVAWMIEEADRQPLLAVWEDLHWADPSTLDLLSALVDQTPTATILHVLTCRPQFVPPWPTRSYMTPITLNRLERPQVEALIARLAGHKALPTEVVEHVVGKTDGVPLFVEELTKMLLESDLLREESERYALTGPLSGVAIPVTLYDSLMARLDRLPAVREVAQLGAVLGREFDYEMLHALVEVEETTLRDRLAQLVDTELLYQRGRPPHATYIFKHALVQDAAYASLLNRTRQRHHQRVAEVLEARFRETVETEPELVAHHYTEGGCHEQAIGYWYQAGQRAVQRSANVEAIVHLRQGIELLTALPETPERIQQELTFQTTLGPALMAARGYGSPEVGQAYNRARELCSQVGETPELFSVLWGMWMFYLGQGDHATSREFGEQCLSLAQRLNDVELLQEAHLALSATLFYLGEFSRAWDHMEQGRSLYDPQRHHHLAFRFGGFDPGVYFLMYGSWTRWALGHVDHALQLGNEGLCLAHSLSHPYTLARGLFWNTLLHQFRGEWQVVHERIDEALPMAADHGMDIVLAVGPIMRGWAVAMQGQGAAGMAHIRQGLEAYQATGAVFQRPHFLGLMAEVHGDMAQPQDGMQAIAEALALVEQTGERYYEAELYRFKGELLLNAKCEMRNTEITPEDCFHQALDIARRQQAKSWELRAATSLARLWKRQGKRHEAYDLLAPVYGWFTEGFDTADLINARALLEELG